MSSRTSRSWVLIPTVTKRRTFRCHSTHCDHQNATCEIFPIRSTMSVWAEDRFSGLNGSCTILEVLAKDKYIRAKQHRAGTGAETEGIEDKGENSNRQMEGQCRRGCLIWKDYACVIYWMQIWEPVLGEGEIDVVEYALVFFSMVIFRDWNQTLMELFQISPWYTVK